MLCQRDCQPLAPENRQPSRDVEQIRKRKKKWLKTNFPWKSWYLQLSTALIIFLRLLFLQRTIWRRALQNWYFPKPFCPKRSNYRSWPLRRMNVFLQRRVDCIETKIRKPTIQIDAQFYFLSFFFLRDQLSTWYFSTKRQFLVALVQIIVTCRQLTWKIQFTYFQSIVIRSCFSVDWFIGDIVARKVIIITWTVSSYTKI